MEIASVASKIFESNGRCGDSSGSSMKKCNAVRVASWVVALW